MTFEISYDQRTLTVTKDGSEKITVKESGDYYSIIPAKHYKKVHLHEIKLTYKGRTLAINCKSTNGGDLLPLYVVIQHVTGRSLAELREEFLAGDTITSFSYAWEGIGGKKVTELIKIYQVMLNMKQSDYNTALNTDDIKIYLSGRGITGERIREMRVLYGFDVKTHCTDKKLKMGQIRWGCPFPCQASYRKVEAPSSSSPSSSSPKKCFSCGIIEGSLNSFGLPVVFENGHLEPSSLNGSSVTKLQCKRCNTTFSDKVTWRDNGGITFHLRPIMRDCPEKEIVEALAKLHCLAKVHKHMRPIDVMNDLGMDYIVQMMKSCPLQQVASLLGSDYISQLTSQVVKP